MDFHENAGHPKIVKSRLAKKEILTALKALDKKLAETGTKAEICLYGGTSMVLAFNARLSTKDVDAVFKPKGIIRKLAEEIAEDLDLEKGWLNDGVKGFLSQKEKVADQGVPQFPYIQITRPTADYLLAMKCMAARAPGYDTQGDRADILFLMGRLKITTEKEALEIIEGFYPKERIAAKTQFFVIECLNQLKNEPRNSI